MTNPFFVWPTIPGVKALPTPADILKPQQLPAVTITAVQDPNDPASEEKRKPFPQFNPFRKFVMDELRHRKTQYPTMPVTPFGRMTSCGIDTTNKYMFFSLGLHGYESGEKNIFDLTYNDNQHDAVGTAIDASSKKRRIISTNEMTAAKGMDDFEATYKAQQPKANRPVPGITSITSKRRGLGEPMTVDVQWICYNRAQLEFLRQHFLIPGTYVVVEFGQNFADRPVEQMMDFEKGEELFKELVEIIGLTEKGGVSSQYGRSRIIKNYNQPNNGNYDLALGQIANFEITLEPETGIYKCTTHLVSQGENVWGIKIDQTYINRDEQKPLEISTIADYFKQKMYDVLISTHLNKSSDGIYKEAGTSFSKSTEEAAKANNVSTNVYDYAWMSWDFLFNEFLDDMFSVIKDTSLNKQLREFMKLGRMGKDDWVGYHPDLISSEAETMLLLNVNDGAFDKDTLNGDLTKTKQDVQDALLSYGKVGRFGSEPDRPVGGAKLGKGLWINTGIIRQCFTDAVDLKQAFTSLLLCMNRAVGGYWQLQLFSDEESASYKIVDYKYGDQNDTKQIDFYKFNVGPDESQPGGECLAVEFDTAFPPELITQMMLVARLKLMTKEDQDAAKAKYPLLGSTSAHMYVLNWSTLEDGMQTRIKAWSEGKPINGTTENNAVGDNSSTSRNVDDDPDGLSAIGTAAGRELNTALGDKIPMAPIDNTRIAAATKPVQPPYQLSAAPVRGTMPISSKMGPRNTGIAGASKNHPGIDIAVASGTSVYAVNPGKVFIAGPVSGYGNAVYIQHDGGFMSVYGHLRDISVRVNDRVRAGQNIGLSGGAKTDPGHGTSSGAHLHFELRHGSSVYPDTLRSLDNAGRVVPSNKSAVAPSDSPPTPNQDTPNTTAAGKPIPGQATTPDEATITAMGMRRQEVSEKFGSHVWSLTGVNRGAMISRITNQGYTNTDVPNSFVAPYPTTTSVTVEIMGIAGISVSDGFFVDRIPSTFEKHGVFQVTDVTDEITTKGWRTKVHGYFKMLWYDANGSKATS